MKTTYKTIQQLLTDNALTYFYWSMGFLGVMSLIYLGYLILLGFNQGIVTMNLVGPAYFVFGVLGAVYIIPDYIRIGVTRRHATIGNLTGILLASGLFIVILLSLNWVVDLLVEQIMANHALEKTVLETLIGVEGGQYNGVFFRSTLMASIVRLIVIFISFILIFIQQFVSGWLIATGFMRFGFWRGLVTLLIGLVVLLFNDDWLTWYPMDSIAGTWLLYSLINLFVIVVAFIITRFLTAKMPIKPS